MLTPVLQRPAGSPHELQLHPEYRVKRGLEGILQKVAAEQDAFVSEKYQDQAAAILNQWSSELLQSPSKTAALANAMSSSFSGSPRSTGPPKITNENSFLRFWRIEHSQETNLGREAFLSEWRADFETFSRLLTAEFQIINIHAESLLSVTGRMSTFLKTVVRFELVGTGKGFYREQRIGHWDLLWEMTSSRAMYVQRWRFLDEERSRASVPVFFDTTEKAFGGNSSYATQLIPGTDHWRTVLDSASGIDIYGHNGVSAGDFDGDGLDDLYICQPAGLPNRLFRNRGDGSFEDVTAGSGVGVLENSACALFADVDNDGKQDLIVVRTTGPLLFLNQGEGKFRLKPNAFQFANPPQGTFTGAAIADYDRDGWPDIYFCLYSYYQGADQYRYPMPYFDAENGPPNFMMRNNHDGIFLDVTKQSGLDQNNNRFSFCCAWGDYNGDFWPDLYVVNDFGRKNLYHNNGDGTFTDVAPQTGAEDVGAGMSGAWFDFDNDGREDLYVADMWTAAGMRISSEDSFQPKASAAVRALFRKHAMGNSLLRNGGDRFEDDGAQSGTTMGRWSWSSDAWDFDHDGYADLYIANGMISGATREDLNSFFWRQVVANSPNEPRPSHEYEQGWNAINELIRSDGTWSGFERNVFYVNNRNGTFSDASGIVGLDFLEDSRSFALADFDQDGRLEVVLKNRNRPQLRYLKNVLPELPPAISFRLSGKKSNRDAVGARITVFAESHHQTRLLQIGSGFLAQHTKEVFFGLGSAKSPVQATIEWPSGLMQNLRDLPPNHRIYVEEGQPPARLEPFKPFSNAPTKAGSPNPSAAEVLPRQFATWLLLPIPAPDFSLSGFAGLVETLSARRGNPVLLYFWSASVEDCSKDLDELEQFYKTSVHDRPQILAIQVDPQNTDNQRRVQTLNRRLFPTLRSTPDLLAAYNLLYRQLFDRHRDMTVPVSFLIDAEGNIVKIYQGPILQARLEEDFKNIPKTDAQRLALALPFPGPSEGYDFGRNYLSLGYAFFERGDFEHAETYFRQAFKDDPSSAEALYGLGSAYLEQQKKKDARESFERVLQMHAHYPGTLPDAWNNLGILEAREGKIDLAIPYFQRALEIDPEHAVALRNLGNAYRQKQDWLEAKRALGRALELNPDDPEANYSLGMVYAQQNDTERAGEYLEKALASRPDYPEALNNLGILYLRTGRPEDAKRNFEQCIRTAPTYDPAYLNLARLYAIEGDRERARGALQDLLKQHPENAEAQAELKRLEQ